LFIELIKIVFQVLAGSNADDGTKALMYLLPAAFPNAALNKPEMDQEAFDDTTERILGKYTLQVRDRFAEN
jgi:hypothetical protein